MPRRRISLVWTVLAVLLLWDGAGWLVIGGLLHPVLPGGWRTIVIAALLVLVPFAKLARSIGGAGYPTALTRIVLFRPFWYAQLLLPLLTIAGLAGMLVGLPFGAGATAGRNALAGAAILLTLLIISGYVGTRRLAVRRLDVSFPDLPAGLDGLKIVQLSDLHVGPHTSRRHLARIAEAVRDAAPDLIALTGDQVDDYARDMEPFAAALGGLSAPLGVFAIAGNHDIIAGWNAVRDGLERLGIVVLVNRSLPLEHGRVRFWIAGIGDPAGRGWQRGGGAGAAAELESGLELPGAGNGNPYTRGVAPLHQPGHQLLGDSLPPRYATRGDGADSPARAGRIQVENGGRRMVLKRFFEAALV